MFKQFDHEGGIMTPLIAHWPGVIEPGSMSNALAHVVDLAPTFLEAAGAPPLKQADGGPALPFDGRSLLPLLKGGGRPAPDTLFWEWNHGRALRQGKWKIVANDKQPWELYDVETDGTELNDLAAEMPEKVAEMEAAWNAWKGRGV
jgi:arylsulfatase